MQRETEVGVANFLYVLQCLFFPVAVVRSKDQLDVLATVVSFGMPLGLIFGGSLESAGPTEDLKEDIADSILCRASATHETLFAQIHSRLLQFPYLNLNVHTCS